MKVPDYIPAATRTWWGQRPLELDVWEACLWRTRRAYESFDHVAVTFSGGKDSTVVLNAALIVAEELGRLPVRTIFFDEEAIPYETEDYCRRVSQDPRVAFEWLCVPIKHRNACSKESPHWWPWAPEARDLWTRPLPPEAITDLPGLPIDPPEARIPIPGMVSLLFPSSLGSVGQIMGIRADESVTRREAVGNKRSENWVIPLGKAAPNVCKVYPAYDMKTADVWTAPARFGWDYNACYDLMEMVGVPQGMQRCAPPYGEQPIQRLWTYKECFPDLWDPMTRRVPGAAAAGLYGRSELYGFKKTLDKPADISWQDFIAAKLAEHTDRETARFILFQIKGMIRLHYSRTSEPILTVPHPFTGVSWPGLYRLAERGDLKRRSRPNFSKTRREYETAWSEEQPATFPGFSE